MKTPLTFLFLFSGSVYGGVFDETIDDVFGKKVNDDPLCIKDGNIDDPSCIPNINYDPLGIRDVKVVVLSCSISMGRHIYLILNKKEKLIMKYVNEKQTTVYEIVKENELFIKGKEKTDVMDFFVYIFKHKYENHIHIRTRSPNPSKTELNYIDDTVLNLKCSVGKSVLETQSHTKLSYLYIHRTFLDVS